MLAWSVSLALQRLKQDDLKFYGNLEYIRRHRLKNKFVLHISQSTTVSE